MLLRFPSEKVQGEELSEYMAPREEAFEAEKAAFIAGDMSKQIE